MATATSQPLSVNARASNVAIPQHDGDQYQDAKNQSRTDWDSGLQPPPAAAPLAKRTKGKKGADPINTSKQIEDTIAQLERSQAVDKDQEIEIGE